MLRAAKVFFLGSFLAGSLFLAGGCGRSELDEPPLDAALDVPDVPDVDVPPIDRPCRSNMECDDSLYCNGTEACVGGTCRRGTVPNCDDGVACTTDVCNERTRACDHRPDDTRCAAPARCDVARGCTSTTCTSDAQCTDGDPCTGDERCVAGRCSRTPPPSCDDGVACTLDTCEPRRGCLHTADDARCEDGSFCNGAERCDPAAGACVPGRPVFCGPSSECTTSRCDEATRRCQSAPTDNDGDGFGPLRCPGGGDCDDSDRAVNPGAPEVCRDGRDNNCNGRSDCDDPTCGGRPECGPCTPTGPERDPMLCLDGRDNDCDGLLDCADPECRAFPSCGGCVPTGPENNPMACRDGRDNDCNGVTDCVDPACRLVPGCVMCVPTGPEGDPMSCADGRDNDCNGQTDCADGRCVMTDACVVRGDTCATAVPITVPGRASGVTTGARDDFTPGCPSSMGAPDVVYVLRNPTRQTITIDTNGSAYDTMLTVRAGDCAMGREIACDDDGGDGVNSRVVLTNAEPGTYFVTVDGFGSGAGAYVLTVSVGATEVCDNRADDDGDGAVDCADTDCARFPACLMCIPTGPEADPMACADGRDNDCDGRFDCADTDCARVCGVCIPTGPENNPTACADGRDNDCDRLTDCADPQCTGVPPCGCVPAPEVCFDGRDNDCDRLVDCADFDCRANPACVMCFPTGPEGDPVSCADGRDNDCDGAIDCADPACAVAPTCGCVPTPEACTDARDNDCDRLVDCADPDCRASPVCGACVPTGLERDAVACRDGRDNDCDRLLDCADPECAMQPFYLVCTPTGPEADATTCRDGRDNDCDGTLDCADPGCRLVPGCTICTPTGPERDAVTCRDGRDNDCDGQVDCTDTECAAQPACAPTPRNDTCAGATFVAVPSVTSGTTAGALNQYTPTTAGFPGCAGGAGPDVVYAFTLRAPTPLTIDVTGMFDPVVHVRRAICETGEQVACNDDTMGTASRVAFVAAPGVYYVIVDGYAATSQGAFTLQISLGLPAEVCTNARDDDADGLTDCADPDCAAAPTCAVCRPTGPENNPMACADGRDNDCDRLTDCADPECRAFPPCGGCVPTGPEGAFCRDGRDNDCDGQTDCADAECLASPLCCVRTGPENTLAACRDGRDNDCDGLPDCRDPECATACGICMPTGTHEVGVAACSDGRDNDCDGVVDCADSDCRPSGDTSGECCNGRDDNGNRLIDEFACYCDTTRDCAGVGFGGPFPSDTCWASTFHICAPRCDMLGGNAFCSMFFRGTTCNAMTGECR